MTSPQVASIHSDEAGEHFLPGPRVVARYGVSDMTIYRWIRDERMQFPQPHYFGRLRFWKLSDLMSWELQRASRPALKIRSEGR